MSEFNDHTNQRYKTKLSNPQQQILVMMRTTNTELNLIKMLLFWLGRRICCVLYFKELFFVFGASNEERMKNLIESLSF
jgi:hypothetical protein